MKTVNLRVNPAVTENNNANKSGAHNMKPPKQIYFVEMTDTYGGEANYSWVKRFLVQSISIRGAISKVTRETGYHVRLDYDCGDMARYNATSAGICYFVQEAEGNETEIYSRIVTL